jgi:hypothetical protein
MLSGLQLSLAISAAARLGVADLLLDGPRSSAELATATGSDPRALRRLLRALAGEGVFAEEGPDLFALGDLGRCLTSDDPGSVRTMAVLSGDVMAPAWQAVMHTLKTGQPGFRSALGDGLYEHLAARDGERAVFDRALAERGREMYTVVAAALGIAGPGVVVEVGGGHGALLAAVLGSDPTLRGVLFDLPEVAEGARAALSDAGLEERCTFVGGDFFREVPPGGDVYLVASVLNDWDDGRAAAILTSCRRAMAPGARLLAVERVVPAGPEPHPAKLNDLNLMVMTGGGERTETEFTALFRAAGLRMTRVAPTASVKSVIEAAPA